MAAVFRCDGSPAVDQRWGKAPGKQDGSVKHLGEGWGGREGRSPR
jgi:hypothetical protein